MRLASRRRARHGGRRRRRLSGTRRSTRTAGTRRRATRETGAHTRGRRPTGESELPPRTRAARTAARTHLAVMVMTVVMTLPRTEHHGTRKEQGPRDECDAGDDHHPRRDAVEPRRLFHHPPWWRCGGCDGACLGCGLGRFSHVLNIAQCRNSRKESRTQSCHELTRLRPGARVSAGQLATLPKTLAYRPGVVAGANDGATDVGT